MNSCYTNKYANICMPNKIVYLGTCLVLYLDADGFEPNKVAPTDKWDGEDEDDDVKDAWDKSDSEEDKSKDSTSEETKTTKTKPKKKLAEKIAEREALKEQQLAERAPLTEEEKLAEKLRLQKMEEKANIQLARDMCGKY